MVNYREIIRLKTLDYSNARVASSCGSSRNTVAEVWNLAKEKNLIWPLDETMTNLDLHKVFYPYQGGEKGKKLPDFEYIHKELARPGVTLSLLWAEYCAQCAEEHAIPYQHSQFNEHYHSYAATKKATLRIHRKPGELMEVDWAGDTLTVYDSQTGEPMKAYVFVACLPCSLYSYTEAFPDMKSYHWIQAHIHAYNFFGGSTRILVPDNLKTGVIKNTRTELVLNRAYHEMAEYYGSAVIPARPVSPKDKPNAEGAVHVIGTWIMAALRNRRFFSFEELNAAIQEKLTEFNAKPFQKKKGSRLSAFLEEEKDFLMPLPASMYETAIWSKATIQPDYLITVGGCKYSVPYEYIGKEVEIRSTEKSIEVFYQSLRIASHPRRQYSQEPFYVPEHMPEKHRRYLEYNAESFLEWAMGVGPSTLGVVKRFLTLHKVEQQGYKPCTSLMRLADRYSMERLEKACERALGYTPEPSLKNITAILNNGQDKVRIPVDSQRQSSALGITRGASYFRGGDL